MAETTHEVQGAVVEERIMRIQVPAWYVHDLPRVCLRQLRSLITDDEGVATKRQDLEDASNWDYEDYDEARMGTRPEGTDPKADVLVCGIGSCTLRVFKDREGNDIEAGECKADGYCLKEKFEAVSSASNVQDGRALYGDIIDSLDGFTSSMSAGNFCPQLICGLSAGVSIDQVPGTAGKRAFKK